ncbi:MAG: hypothetical protein U0169_08265 [Polyangiaceae bacterium]
MNRVVATSALPLVRDTAAFVSACRAGAKGTEPFVEARAAFLRLRGN